MYVQERQLIKSALFLKQRHLSLALNVGYGHKRIPFEKKNLQRKKFLSGTLA
jgi:hypothetical protein